jgi:hypothetical protein
MDTIGRGIIAGFVATLILSVLLDPLATLARSAGVLVSPAASWMLHFVVGTLVWGTGFALLHDHMRGPPWLRGVIFGFGAWILVMLSAIPLARAGLFGFELGFAPPLVMLLANLIFGGLLGALYGLLDPEQEPALHGTEHDELHPIAR